MIDMLLLCYIAVGALNLCIIHPEGLNQYTITQWTILFLCYISVRRATRKQWILWGIVLIGAAESAVGILQKLHWLDSHHSMFDMTGTFGNPGQLGGFLAVAITVTWGLYQLRKKQCLIKQILLGVLLLLTITLLLSDSRAGWLATLVGCIYVWHVREKKRCFSLYARVIIPILVVLLLAGAYYYKKDSANGRLLIWHVSANMIADAPLTGHGIGAFEKKYMYYQARYFEANPESAFKMLADNVIYPYNELLHIAVELGIPGLLMGILLIIVTFKYASPRKENATYIGAVISLLVFSVFSYPSHVIILLLLFPILLGAIACEKGISLPKCLTYKHLWWGIYIIGLCLSGKGWYEYTTMENRLKELYASPSSFSQASGQYLKKHLDELKSAPRFLDLYAQYSYQHFPITESLPILQQTASIIPTSEILCDLGDLYFQQNQIGKAIECYQLSSNMIPNRIIPRYKLFQLYCNIGDSVQMRITGEKLLYMSIKVESTQTLRIKGEVKRYLN